MISTVKTIHQVLSKAARGEHRFGIAEAKQIGDALKLYWRKFDVDQFVLDLNGELNLNRVDMVADDIREKLSVIRDIIRARFNE